MATPLFPCLHRTEAAWIRCSRPLVLLTPLLPQSGQIDAILNSSVQQFVNMAVDVHKSALPHASTVLAKRTMWMLCL